MTRWEEVGMDGEATTREEYVSRAEAAKRWGVCTKTVDNWIRAGILPAMKGRRSVRIPWRRAEEALAARAG